MLNKKLLTDLSLSCARGGKAMAELKAVLSRLALERGACVFTTHGQDLVCVKGKGAKKIVFYVNITSPGFTAAGYNDLGEILISCDEEVSSALSPSFRVKFENGIKGVVEIISENHPENRSFGKIPSRDLYAAIGAEDKKQAEELVPGGMTAVFASPVLELAADRIAGLNTRAALIYAALELLSSQVPSGVTLSCVYYSGKKPDSSFDGTAYYTVGLTEGCSGIRADRDTAMMLGMPEISGTFDERGFYLPVEYAGNAEQMLSLSDIGVLVQLLKRTLELSGKGGTDNE